MTIIFESVTSNGGEVHASLGLKTRFAVTAAALFDASLDLRTSFSGHAYASGEVHAQLPDLRAVFYGTTGAVFAARLDLTATFEGEVPQPEVVAFIGNLPLTASFSGTANQLGEIHGSVGLRTTMAGGALFRATLQPVVYFTDSSLPVKHRSFLVQQPELYASMSVGTLSTYGEGLVVGDAGSMKHVMVRSSAMAMDAAQPSGLLVGSDLLTEELVFDDVVRVIWKMLGADAADIGEVASIGAGKAWAMAEALALAAGEGSALDAVSVLIEALRMAAGHGYTVPVVVAEALALGAVPDMALDAIELIAEHMAIAAIGTIAARFAVLVPEGLVLGDSMSSAAELFQLIVEGAVVLATIQTDDGTYMAWVCHPGSKSFTGYSNFPFNSFCELGGHYYGASDDGIYLLEGDDDAGAPINASFRTGLSDFGTGRMKRPAAMYLGYRSEGQLLLKVVTTDDDGNKLESWYSLDAQPGNAMKAGRVKVGKGLESTYWAFEVANIDGADFEIDTMQFLPMVLDRRLR